MNDSLIILGDNKLTLCPSVLSLINASPGDRLEIEYVERDGELMPILVKSIGGNKLNKNNSISLRGKANDTLSLYGTKFSYLYENNLVYLVGHDPRQKVFTEVKASINHINKEIIEDKNFNINFNSYKL